MRSINTNHDSPHESLAVFDQDRFQQIDLAIARNQYQQDALIEILHTAQSSLDICQKSFSPISHGK
jgi:NADH:ubiquinone oxidoreductase subunit E